MSIQQLTVQLPHFEGPLGLLIYLIRKEEMDIMDIKIHEITAQYLDYIKLMKELDVEVAGEFIAMAATLIHIKSRMLLPQYDENGEIIEQEDPRKELVQKLMEYQKYQEAAKLLADRPWVGRDIFLRGIRENFDVEDDSIELEDNALFSLIGAYRRTLRALNKRVHKVTAKAQSIASRILEIRDRLIVGVRVTMNELISATENRGRATLITFLSLLELGRMGFVKLAQNEPYSDIWIVAERAIEDAAISRVEEYDNINASAVADELTTVASVEESEEEMKQLDLMEGGQELSLENMLNEPNEEIDLGDIATDDEILAAERELAGLQPEAPVAADESIAMEASIAEAAGPESFEVVDATEIPLDEALNLATGEAADLSGEERASFAGAESALIVDGLPLDFVETSDEAIETNLAAAESSADSETTDVIPLSEEDKPHDNEA